MSCKELRIFFCFSASCSSEVATAVGLTVGLIVLIEVLIALPIIAAAVVLCLKRYTMHKA